MKVGLRSGYLPGSLPTLLLPSIEIYSDRGPVLEDLCRVHTNDNTPVHRGQQTDSRTE